MSTEELEYERYQQRVWEKNHPQCAAKLAACERQVNELAEINKELLEALNDVFDSGLLYGSTILHDRIRVRVCEAIAKAEK